MEDTSINEDADKERGEKIVLEDTEYSSLKQIPIEIIQDDSAMNVNQVGDSDIDIIGTILDLDESDVQQLLLDEELKSNRTSLIITHEDGSTEEAETEVTCLGLTPEHDHRNSLHIQEIFMAANKIQEELGKQDNAKAVEINDYEHVDDISLLTVGETTEPENIFEIEDPMNKQEIKDNKSQHIKIFSEHENIKAKCHKENKEFKELIQRKDVECVPEKSSKEVKLVNSEQIRSIPISLPDGRHVINRSISNDVIENCIKESSQTNQQSHTKRESLNDSQLTKSVEKSDISHPQDIDACNLSNQINSDNREDTSADKGSVKQTEAAALSISHPPTDTCSESENTLNSSVQQISTTSKSKICESESIKEESSSNLKSETSRPKPIYRTIPITIEREEVGKEDITPEKTKELETRIPIEILTSAKLSKSVSDQGVPSENHNMKSVRTVPIQRLSDSNCDSFNSLMTKSVSKESLGQSTQKIKMGTAAIRIPIQVQKTTESPSEEDIKHGLEGGASSLKPPQSVRTVPILRQSLSDSGVSPNYVNEQSSRSRNVSSINVRDEKLRKVHEQLEEARIKVAAQADALSEGYEHLLGRSGNRSKSLDVEQRYNELGAKPKQPTPSQGQKDRSLQDIDKDIETIWNELQVLEGPSVTSKLSSSQGAKQLSDPLAENENSLLKPSLKREPNSSRQNKASVTSASNPNISSNSSKHTIWDIPEKKYEPATEASMSSSWDHKPNYFPSKSNTHFSFLPKAKTRPGFITPAYGEEGSRFSLDKSDRKSPSRPHARKASGSASDLRKSCLKTQSTQSLKSRSQSPSVVKFSPKIHKKGVEHTDPPFEWIEFRRKDGEIVKGTVLPPIHRDNDIKIPKHVPIVNMVIDDNIREPGQSNSDHKTYESVQIKETPKPSAISCDAGTQTEKLEKKGGCLIM